jgi:hypothetical protein
MIILKTILIGLILVVLIDSNCQEIIGTYYGKKANEQQ